MAIVTNVYYLTGEHRMNFQFQRYAGIVHMYISIHYVINNKKTKMYGIVYVTL